MASTPEAKVKRSIHVVLKEFEAYAVNYIGGQYANNGTPDILACMDGRFIAIEAKAGRGKLTALQYRALETIDRAGGLALVIYDGEIPYLYTALTVLRRHGNCMSNYRQFKPTGYDDLEKPDDDQAS